MRFPFPSRFFGPPSEGGESPFTAEVDTSEPPPTFLKTVAWVSAGVGALVLGLVVGREIRLRYKFTRRTPYDFYAHAGDEHDMEFGVGI